MKASQWLVWDDKQWPGQVFSKNIKAKFIVCIFCVTRVVTFGVLLYRNQ